MKVLITFIFLLSSLTVSASAAYDRIRIVVNDRVITQNEIDVRLLEFIRQKGQTSISPQQEKELRSQLVNLLIEEALLDFQADELKITMTEEQLDAELDLYRKRNRLSQIEFEELLERRNISLTDFRTSYLKRTRRSLVINQEIKSQISISDERLKTLYEKGEGKTMRVRARHILLIVDKNAVPGEVERVRQKIASIREQIQSGNSFSEMADRHSQDPSVKNNHGDLGFFGKNDMVREFADVAFSIEPGIISEPVRSPFGFHLIEVLEKKEDPKQDFKSVRPKLHQQEYRKEFEKMYRSYIADLKQKAKIIRR